MGSLFSRHKNDGGKRFLGIPICPSRKHNSQKVFKKVTVYPEQPKVMNERSDQSATGWITVPLHVPDSSVNGTPIPPPRKHKGKGGTLPRTTPLAVEESVVQSHKTKELLSDTRVPVEEPMIVPKKEPVHICDGHHHHVVNTVDGKVIHDTHVHSHSHKEDHVHPTKPQKPDRPARPKHSSTVSLPDFDELNKNVKKHKIDPTQPYRKKKATRHISVVSLPTESKVSLSAATVARLENYMMRCKSFGALPPKQLLEKLQNSDLPSDSDDSWEGLDDWDMGVIEHDSLNKSPLEPKYRLLPQKGSTQPSTVEHQFPETIVEDVEEYGKRSTSPPPPPQSVITLKRTERRRESIDDFFDAQAQYPIKHSTLEELKKESAKGRRGSDGIFGYDKKCYPFRDPDDSTLNSDTFFSNALIMSESRLSEADMRKKRRQSAGDALHKIAKKEIDQSTKIAAEDDLLNTFQDFYKNKPEPNDDTDSSSKLKEAEQNPEAESSIKAANTEKVEHSSLLKFLQDNSSPKESSSGESKPYEDKTLPLQSALKDVEEKLKKLDEIKIIDRE